MTKWCKGQTLLFSFLDIATVRILKKDHRMLSFGHLVPKILFSFHFYHRAGKNHIMVILYNMFLFIDLLQMSMNALVYHVRMVVFAPMRLEDTHVHVLLDLWELTVISVSSHWWCFTDMDPVWFRLLFDIGKAIGIHDVPMRLMCSLKWGGGC